MAETLSSFPSYYWLLILLFCLFQPQIHHDTAVKLPPSSVSAELSLHVLSLFTVNTTLSQAIHTDEPLPAHPATKRFALFICFIWKDFLPSPLYRLAGQADHNNFTLHGRRRCRRRRRLNCCQRSWLRV